MQVQKILQLLPFTLLVYKEEMKMLKKILLTILLLSFVYIGSFAAESVNINEAKEQDGTVTVKFNVTNLKSYDDVTLIVFKKTADNPDPNKDNIVYLNQTKPINAEISFELPTSDAAGTYELRMGGTDVENAAVYSFEIVDILFGDVNNDGEITISDVVWIMRNISGAEMADYINIENGNVNSDNKISISDAVWILRYLSGSEIPDYVNLPK